MPRPIARRLVLAAALAVSTAANAPALLAQSQPAQLPQQLQARGAQIAQVPALPAGIDQRQAEEIRNDLRELMRQYPPALAQVLRLDPALVSNAAYLAPYPALAAFVQARPEVSRHADYFFSFAGQGNWWSEPTSPEMQLRRDAMNMQRQVIDSLGVGVLFAGFAFAVFSLVRLFIGHRRWIRATRLQSELNNRLLERMGSNEQLLAYLQSQAGQQLTATPPVAEATAPLAAPFSRILWAVQAGIVLISGGIGFLVIRRYVVPEAGEALLTIGVLAISVGLGFALASIASYLLSQRFGLLDGPRDRAGESGRA